MLPGVKHVANPYASILPPPTQPTYHAKVSTLLPSKEWRSKFERHFHNFRGVSESTKSPSNSHVIPGRTCLSPSSGLSDQGQSRGRSQKRRTEMLGGLSWKVPRSQCGILQKRQGEEKDSAASVRGWIIIEVMILMIDKLFNNVATPHPMTRLRGSQENFPRPYCSK